MPRRNLRKLPGSLRGSLLVFRGRRFIDRDHQALATANHLPLAVSPFFDKSVAAVIGFFCFKLSLVSEQAVDLVLQVVLIVDLVLTFDNSSAEVDNQPQSDNQQCYQNDLHIIERHASYTRGSWLTPGGRRR